MQLLITILLKQCDKNRSQLDLQLDFLAMLTKIKQKGFEFLSENTYEDLLLEEQHLRYIVERELSNTTFKINKFCQMNTNFISCFFFFLLGKTTVFLELV